MFSGHFIIIPSKAKYYLLAFHLLLRHQRKKKTKQNPFVVVARAFFLKNVTRLQKFAQKKTL
jgi:hypothetical protein